MPDHPFTIPAGVTVAIYQPVSPPIQLTDSETVINLEMFIAVTLRQVDARLRGRDWLAGNYTLKELFDRLDEVGLVLEAETMDTENE